jgi:isoleucyl-tRNA synthetase
VARDLVRVVQQRRREAGLHVSDRIALTLGLPAAVAATVTPHLAMIVAETLATRHEVRADAGDANADLDGVPVFVGVERLP